ncbi:MAG: hypothetical protein EZS28_004559 [Streblomastix strix]|uniref:Anaphase-promoting complex subunit 4 WD40 domain-containing protein n=1 Tax=Streblomastix strix TaxID=222440 RepID=A0A5J4WZY7_9EUKA|nr:MAG: hypothetical protein EZS28_004559 [Streblomastix strix]
MLSYNVLLVLLQIFASGAALLVSAQSTAKVPDIIFRKQMTDENDQFNISDKDNQETIEDISCISSQSASVFATDSSQSSNNCQLPQIKDTIIGSATQQPSAFIPFPYPQLISQQQKKQLINKKILNNELLNENEYPFTQTPNQSVNSSFASSSSQFASQQQLREIPSLICFWDVPSRSILASIQPQITVITLQVSNQGEIVAVVGKDENGKSVLAVYDLNYSGLDFATASVDGTVRIWNIGLISSGILQEWKENGIKNDGKMRALAFGICPQVAELSSPDDLPLADIDQD